MKSRARNHTPGMVRNRMPRNDVRSSGDVRNKRRSRRMFFETLERRELLTVAPGDEGTIWESFPGNFVPAQEYKSAVPNYLTGPQAGAPVDIAVDYLKQNAVAFGALANDFGQHFVTDQYTDDATGITHVYLQQKFNGLPVAGAYAGVHINAAGQILAASANFVRNLSNANPVIVPAVPAITALDALASVGSATGRYVYPSELENVEIVGGQSQKLIYSGSDAASLSADPIPMELHYVPKPGGGVELAWKITIRYPEGYHWFEASVGAQSGQRVGQVITLNDWVDHAAYNVFAQPVDDPADGPRRVAIDPHSVDASPFGWHDINGVPGPEYFDLRGNNVTAQEDLNGNFMGGTRPASQILEFNDFFFPTAPPSVNLNVATTNVFYWVNLAHDITAQHGFDEISGNFQVKNYSTEGKGQDAIKAFTQSPLAVNNAFITANNAFFAVPPDGQEPFMAFGITTIGTTPFRDTALDSVVIVHEFTHGVSNRLTGGPFNVNSLDSLQSGGMGEGWGDWLGMLLTIDPGDTRDTPRTLSEYAFGIPGGIRRQPYSYDMAIDPLTLDDFNGTSPFGFPNSEVHAAGEIWASALWDLSWLMIERYGFDSDWFNGGGGNNRVMDIVLEGMKLQPANPSFTEARDAILAADLALNNNANFELIWQAFSRRGFGAGAFDGGGAASDVVVEDFTAPNPLARVSGKVIEDANGNGQINAGELGLAGWTVYVDANKNGVLDFGDRSTVSAADGSWSLPLTSAGTHTIREVVQPGFKATNPSSGSFSITVSLGSNITNKNFLNQQQPGSIQGIKFNDLNSNGLRDAGEPGIAGVIIYVDFNKDGRIGVLEKAATTDANGNYRISNVPVGTGYQVREVAKPGLIQTFPDPADPATLGGAHIDVAVAANTTTTGINFGNLLALDFGDAPASYGTLLANNGPRHGILAGFGLTFNAADPAGVVDAEPNGQPHPSALGDDVVDPAATPPKLDDENGVQFLAGLVPGSTGSVRVGVRTGGFSPALLQGWVDFNRDGDFLDAGERIITDRQLGQGIFDLSFAVPANAVLGSTFARFRYGFERGIGPLGAASAGEVEDLTTSILQDQAIASDDIFPDPAFGDPFIKLNSDFTDLGNSLDVLRNDFGTSTDPTPEIIAANFSGPGQTLTTSAGGTVKFIGPTSPLQYKPKPGFTGVDTFQYQVIAGGSTSAFGMVTITVSPSDPIAIDDIFRISPAAGAIDILVLANDLAVPSQQVSIVSDPTPLSAVIPAGLSLTRSPLGDKLVLTRLAGSPAATFTGTVRFAYTIDDVGDPTTAPSTAVVTLQITDGDTTPAASHLAIFRTRYLRADAAGDPILGPGVSTIFLADSDFFWVELVVQDPANAGDNPATIGVESAYIDLIVNSFPTDPTKEFVDPVVSAGKFVIQYEPAYGLVQRDDATFSEPGTVQEIGATRGTASPPPAPIPPPTGNGEVVVMRIKFQAKAGGNVIVQADHADSSNLAIALAIPAPPPPAPPPSPLEISDDQVFIHKAGMLQIVPDGAEGEFTNRDNVYDVTGDGNSNTLDILMLINDLTQNGPRSLNQLAIALSGILPAGFLDVNIDAQVNTLDILNLINYLTARGATGQASAAAAGEGESAAEGESAPSALAASSGSPAAGEELGVMVNLLAWQQSQDGSGTTTVVDQSDEVIFASASSNDEPIATAAPSTKTGTTTTNSLEKSGEVDSEAADEYFGSLSSFREQFRSRRLARR